MSFTDQIQTSLMSQEDKVGLANAEARVQELNATVQPPRPSYSLPNPSTSETMDQLDADPQVKAAAQVIQDYAGTDNFHMILRMHKYNTGSAVKFALESGDMPKEVQAAYKFLTPRFDNADTGSSNQGLEAAWQIGLAVITDPINAASFLLAPFTGGASLEARAAAGEGIVKGAQWLTKAKLGMFEGAGWTGVQSWAEEKAKEQLGLNDGVDATKVLSSMALGGVAGGILGRFIDGNTLEKTERAFSETRFSEENTIHTGEQLWSKLVSLVGKPASILDPSAKISEAAGELQKKFRYDTGKDINWFTQDKRARPIAEKDYNEVANELTGDFHNQYKEAIAPILTNGRVLAKDTGDALLYALRAGEDAAKEAGIADNVVQAANKVRGILDDRGHDLLDHGLLESNSPPTTIFNGANTTEYQSLPIQNYVTRRWKRDVIEANRGEFESQLFKDGQAKSMADAKSITDDMLDIKNQLYNSSGSNGIFSNHRALLDINDNNFSKFLDNDVNAIMNDYNHQTSAKLAERQVFGTKNEDEFVSKWINKIGEDYTKAGLEFPKGTREDILNLYKYATGNGLERLGSAAQSLKDWGSLAYSVSMLPLSTVSSLSEIVLPLARVTVPNYMKGLAQGSADAFKHIAMGTLDMLKINHGMTEPEAFKEMNSVGVALNQVVSDGYNRLTGDGMRSPLANQIQRGYFKLNLLTDWTRFVQGSSFVMGKAQVTDNLRWLSQASDHTNNTAIRIRNELSDLGVDYSKGVEWYKNGANKDDPFYKQVVEAGARFAEEITVPTSKRAGTKPLYMSSPKWDILYQFMGYPTAFSNTVMNRMVQDFAESPVRGGAKIAVAGTIMTAMARWLNYVRSDGKSEEGKTDGEANWNAIARWGGNGQLLDILQRSKNAATTFGTPLAAPIGIFGPIVADTASIFATRKGPVQLLGQKVPGYTAGYGALGKQTMDDYNTWLRSKDQELVDIFMRHQGRERQPGEFSR